MNGLLSSAMARAEDLPLRPLLFAVGAAAAGISTYCYVKRGDEKKTDPVCEQDTEPALVKHTEVVQDQMKEDGTEDDKIQNHVVPNTQLEDRVKELEELLYDTRRNWDIKNKEHGRVHEACSILEKEYSELQKFSVDETEEMHQNTMETIAQLVRDKSDLTEQVKTLKDRVQDMEDSFIDTNLESDELMNAYSLLQEEKDELKKTLIHREKLQKVSLAEAAEKHQRSLETIGQLEEEKADLTNQVKTLRKILKEIEDRLIDTNLECDDLMNEHERERKAYSILQEEYNNLKKTLIHCEELRKISLVDAEEKHQNDLGTIAQLKVEKSDLINQMKTLKDTVQDMRKQLIDTNMECEDLRNYCKQEREAYNILQVEYHELEFHKEELLKVSVEKKQKAVEIITQLEEERCNLANQVKSLRDTVHDMGNQLFETNVEFDELMNEHEEEQKAYGILQKRYDELKKTLVYNEELQKEADEKHKKAVEAIAELEKEKCDLLKQVKTLSDTVEYMGKQLAETHTQYDEMMNESLSESVEKHQEALETIGHLKAERTELTNQVKTLRHKMKDITYLICVTQKQCEQLTQKFERQREAHCRLHDENGEMNKPLKVSLCEAEEKHQKAVVTIGQLEEEQSELTKQLETLRVTVQDMGDKISETNQEFDEFTDKSDKSPELKETTSNNETETGSKST